MKTVLKAGSDHYRDFAWRNTDKPYFILLSEIMLQQTQVVRVIGYYDAWTKQFPSIDSLAAASTAEVLEAWQGLGYNRRALMLKRLATEVSENQEGRLPKTYEDLLKLPGVGPATAAGVMAFAHHSPAAYLETNERTVVLHELFPDRQDVCDKDVLKLVKELAKYVHDKGIDARTWNYALLDYGAYLKKAFRNPSRRSKQHSVQSRFEGSFRQKRAGVLKIILEKEGLREEEILAQVKADKVFELDADILLKVLSALSAEGFIKQESGKWKA
jgi:A/G-specific adenine glycosylase